MTEGAGARRSLRQSLSSLAGQSQLDRLRGRPYNHAWELRQDKLDTGCPNAMILIGHIPLVFLLKRRHNL
jgi:hypothetical protein